MKRANRQLCVLAVVLAICGAAYLGVRWWNETRAETDDAVCVLEWTDLSGLAFEREGTALSFAKGGDGLWYSADEPDFPLEQSCLTDLEETLSALKAVTVFRDPEEDASYGLDAPVLRVAAELSDGTTGVLLVGSAVNGGYYARLEDGDTVYTISSALMDGTDMGLMEMIALEEFPVVTEANAVSITLSLDGETLTFTQETVAGGDAAADACAWSLDGEALPEDDEALAAALSALPGLSFTSCHAWRPDLALQTDCGLERPARVTVTYLQGGSEEQYTLLLGGTDGAGNYYAQIKGSEQLNILRASAAQALLGLAEAGAAQETAQP